MKVSAVMLAVSNPVGAVIPDFALVKAGSGIKMLRDVAEGEEVLSADERRKLLAPGLVVSNKPRSRRNSTIQIDLGDRIINAAPDQVLFNPAKDKWINAEDLGEDDMLLNEEMQHQQIVSVNRISHLLMFTRAVQIEATHQLFVDGVLTHNTLGDWWELAKTIGKEIAKEAVKEAGKAVVKEAVHEVVGYMKESGVDVDNGRDPRGKSWNHHNLENEKMTIDLATGQMKNPETGMEIVMNGADWRNLPGNHPASKPDPFSSCGDGYVRAGNNPVQMEFANGRVEELAPGHTFTYGFNGPVKVDGVALHDRRSAEPVSRPGAAPAPSKPAAAPKPSAAPQPKPAATPVAQKPVAPAQQPAARPAPAVSVPKEVQRRSGIFFDTSSLPKFPAVENRPARVEIRSLHENQRSAGAPVMDMAGFVALRQQFSFQKPSATKE